jgi:nitrate/nitrite-specific signal transduction histidine kinase
MANRSPGPFMSNTSDAMARRPFNFNLTTGVQTIRTRLILAFFMIVLLPMTGITILLTASGLQGGRQKLFYQLETIGSFKESSLRDLIVSLKEELNNLIPAETAIVYINLLSDPGSAQAEIETTHEQLYVQFLHLLNQSQHFQSFFLVDNAGKVVFSTDPERTGQTVRDESFYIEALQNNNIHPITYSEKMQNPSVIITRLLTEPAGKTIAVLVGEVRPERVQYIMTRSTGLGETGLSYLVTADNRLLTRLPQSVPGMKMTSLGVIAALNNHSSGHAIYRNYTGDRVVGVYRWLPEYQVALIIEQATKESDRSAFAILALNLSLAIASLTIAVVASLAVTRSIAAPVSDLVDTASRIAAGQLELTAPVERQDEIGVLAQAFNAMTAQLRNLIAGLEQRIAERTADLRQRTRLLEASAEVAQAAASILQPTELIEKVVGLIRNRFDLYYVGLFLVEQAGEWAVLRAGTGAAGQAMLARGHRLNLSQSSMISWCINNARARVALEAGADQVRLATPELPFTRSEAALPLRSRGQVLGALTIQSDRANAFTEDTITVLQAMTDLVAIALDNANLLAASQEALEAERRAYGEMTRRAWNVHFKNDPDLCIRSTAQGTSRAESYWRKEMVRAFNENQVIHGLEQPTGENIPLAVPVKVRGIVIGVLEALKPAPGWKSEEIQLFVQFADQLGLALDSARMYHESQLRAERERVTHELTNRLHRTNSIDDLIKLMVSEIAAAIGASESFLQLSVPPEQNLTTNNNGHPSNRSDDDQQTGNEPDLQVETGH